MRVVAASAPHSLEVSERETPEPGPGEVRVSVQACGICGSDLHLMRHGLEPGHVLGHEVAGVIGAVGPGVTDIEVGASVVVEPLSSCGTCEACRAGRPMWCGSVQIYGVQLPGGMADSMLVPVERVHRVDAELAPEVAALVEPVAVGVHACRSVALEPGERVLVLGAGAIGLLALLAARAQGAGEVWITARHAHQAELAHSLGAARVLDAGSSDTETLRRLGRELDIDVAIETVGGNANTLDLATAAIRPGGRISVVGLFDSPLSIDPMSMLMKEAHIAFSNCYAHPRGEPADFDVAARLVEDERERLSALCTHGVPLEEAARGFALAGDKSSGAIKVSLLPGSTKATS